MTLSLSAQRGLLLQCREGFESDLAAEMADLASFTLPDGSSLLPAGYTKATPRTGYVVTVFSEDTAPLTSQDLASRGILLPQALTTTLRKRIFARQTWFYLGRVANLPEENKAAPLAEAVASLLEATGFSGFVRGSTFEAPDTNDGKGLLAFCKGFAPHFDLALGRLLPSFRAVRAPGAFGVAGDREALEASGPRFDVRVYFTGWKECHVGVSLPLVTSAHLQGIPRLKFPPQAPSRSTLKLEEAFVTLLSESERVAFLKPGLTAVDLGAAPGGWTYQFVRRDMHVTAVDNGSIDAGLLSSGLVEHRREDGFRFRPRKPVDWLVCDMVEQPARVARLASEWVREGDARRAIFNLKLPMKSRYAEVSRCLEGIRADLEAAGMRPVVRCRHLYHDREEVTCYLSHAEKTS